VVGNLIFFLSISSGSAMAARYLKWKYEFAIPITTSMIVMILFLFGCIDKLLLGALLVLGATILMWLTVFFSFVFEKISNKDYAIAQFRKNFFSDGFWLFFIMYIILNYAACGMLVHNWDEFAHWGAVVKEMVIENCFGTRTTMQLNASNYPPGMSLFQYYIEVIHELFSGNGLGILSENNEYLRADIFSEWRLYLSYNVFTFALYIPLISIVATEIKVKSLIYIIYLFLPCAFYRHYYHNIYIDAFLGILCGTGIVVLFLSKSVSHTTKNKRIPQLWILLYLMAICFILAISKSSGLLFSFVIIVGYFIAHEKVREKLLGVALLAFSSLGPWILWNKEVKASSKMTTATNPISIDEFISLFKGEGAEYRLYILQNFKKAIFGLSDPGYKFLLGDTKVNISYFTLLLLMGLVISICLVILKKSSVDIKPYISMVVLIFIQWLLFYVGLLITYLFEFTEEQGTALASYTRYNNTCYLGMGILTSTIIIRTLIELQKVGIKKYMAISGVLIIAAVVIPWSSVYSFISRRDVCDSLATSASYEEVVRKIKAIDHEDRINVYVIYQSISFYKSGGASLNTYLRILPDMANYKENPFVMSNEKEEWYIADYSPQEWMDILCDNYDYVAIYVLNDYFINKYRSVFKDEIIMENSIYKVDKDNRLLCYIP